MVRAILDGTKTQSRRILKPQPEDLGGAIKWKDYFIAVDGGAWIACPYGQPGDRIWVRETSLHFGNEINIGPNAVSPYVWRALVEFKADETCQTLGEWPINEKPPVQKWWNTSKRKWTPSIHMPRWASRINLEIVSVQVKRLADISEADAQAEGVACAALCEHTHIPQNELNISFQYLNTKTYRSGFIKAWEGLYGDDSWYKNPWVWVIEFKRI